MRHLSFLTGLVLCIGTFAIPSSAQTLPSSVQYNPVPPPDTSWPIFRDIADQLSAPGSDFANEGVGRGQAWADVVGRDPSDPSNPGKVGPPDGLLDLVQANSNSPALPLGAPVATIPGIGSDPKPCVVFRQEPNGTFHDVTALMVSSPTSGFNIQYPGGSPWGVIAGDIDADGDVDLYFPCGGFNVSSPNALLRNEGNGKFSYISGPAGMGHNQTTFGAAWFDYDVDGDLDLYAVNSSNVAPSFFQGSPTNPVSRLYENLSTESFVDVGSAALVNLRGAGTNATTSDLDLNGYPDLAISCWRQWNKVFYNNGDKTFSFMTPAATSQVDLALDDLVPDPAIPGTFDFGFIPPGLNDLLPIRGRTALPINAADFNNDGWPDLIFGLWSSQLSGPNNDGAENSFFEPAERHYMYLNRGDQDGDGLGDGLFREVGTEVGFDHVGGTMGLMTADFNADGFIDIYCGNGGPFLDFQLEEDLLYINNGASWPADFQQQPDQSLPKIFYEVGALTGTYSNRLMAHGLTQRSTLDDGRVDLIVANGGPALFDVGQRNAYYRNIGLSDGRVPSSFLVQLTPTISAPGAYGTRVRLLRGRPKSGARWTTKERLASVGFASSNLGPLAFGLGDDDLLYTSAAWSSGVRQGRFVLGQHDNVISFEEPTLSMEVDQRLEPGGGKILTIRLEAYGPGASGDLLLQRISPAPLSVGTTAAHASSSLPHAAAGGAGSGSGLGSLGTLPSLPPQIPSTQPTGGSTAPPGHVAITSPESISNGWRIEAFASLAEGLSINSGSSLEHTFHIGPQAGRALYRFVYVDPSTGEILAEAGTWHSTESAGLPIQQPDSVGGVAPGPGPNEWNRKSEIHWNGALEASLAQPSAPVAILVVRAEFSIEADLIQRSPAQVPLSFRPLPTPWEVHDSQPQLPKEQLYWEGSRLVFTPDSSGSRPVLSFRDGSVFLTTGSPEGCCAISTTADTAANQQGSGEIFSFHGVRGPLLVDGVAYSAKGERLK